MAEVSIQIQARPISSFVGECWQFALYDPAEPPEAFGRFAPLVARWQALRPRNGLPRRSDFDMEDLGEWIGWLGVTQVLQVDPFDGMVRLWGTKLRDAFGEDFTGSRLQEIDPKHITEEDLRLFRAVACEGLIGAMAGPMNWNQRDFIGLRSLVLPCGENGLPADQVLEIFERVDINGL